MTPRIARPTITDDDSDNEFIPTPAHSPGGPDYEDIPPSYDEAQQQAVADARNGIAPLDANQIEAHRLTLNDNHEEAQIWEYRVRGENLEENEHEQAPEYARSTPIRYVQSSKHIPVTRTGSSDVSSNTAPNHVELLLTSALRFAQQEPDADAQFAPRLLRVVALPQEPPPTDVSSAASCKKGRGKASTGDVQRVNEIPNEPVLFPRAYAKALHAHSIRPAEFMDFIDGFNALCKATNTHAPCLLQPKESLEPSRTIVHDFLAGANEAFFAPRGLRVSLQTHSSLVQLLNMRAEEHQSGQRLSNVSIVDNSMGRAQSLYPWIEPLESNVPEPSSQALVVQNIASSLTKLSSGSARTSHCEGPTRAGSDEPEYANQNLSSSKFEQRGWGGRGGRRGGPWSPFGPHGYGPFNQAGHAPFGHHGYHGRTYRGYSNRGLSDIIDNGPLGQRGHGYGRHRGRGHFHSRSNEAHSIANNGDWATWGKDIGKWGEEYDRKMEDWGRQFGKQAEAWARDFGKTAEIWGRYISAQASGSNSQCRNQVIPDPGAGLARHGGQGSRGSHDHALQDPVGRESGDPRQSNEVLSINSIAAADYKVKKRDHDDDTSSISSDSSDSDSDSDGEEYPDAEAIFVKKIESIDKEAKVALQKGRKKEEVEKEHDLAIEEAHKDRNALELKIEEKQMKRAVKISLKQRSREIKKQYREKKRELKVKHAGKGKGKAKKSNEWREAKRAYKETKRELREEKLRARKEWQQTRYDQRRFIRDVAYGQPAAGNPDDSEEQVWLVIDNLNW